MQAQMRDRSPRSMVMNGLIVALVGVLLAILGPFGTYHAPMALRLAYWVGLLMSGNLLYLTTVRLLAGLALRWDLPDAMVWIGGAVLGSVPMTAIVAIVNRATFGFFPQTADQWLHFYFLVLVISFCVTGIMWLVAARQTAVPTLENPSSQAAPSDGSEPAMPVPRLLDRLPLGKRGDIWALESEDHYVRVHGSFGSELILMRLRDAIAEMDGVDGAQTHRSWWVARQAVTGTVITDRLEAVLLPNGAEAPVARASAAELTAKGWAG